MTRKKQTPRDVCGEARAATVRDNLAGESNPTSPAGNTVFLQDRGIAALPHFFGKCYTIICPRGPKGAKKEKNSYYKTYVSISTYTYISL